MTVKMEATTEEKQAISHKGENRKDYTMQFKKKKKTVQCEDDTNVTEVVKRFKVEQKKKM